MPITIKRASPTPKAEPAKPATEVYTFQCMLAASEIPTEDQIPIPCLVSFKYDGIRAAVTSGEFRSRKMLPIPNAFIQQWVRAHGDLLDGLDGELIVGPPNLETTFNTSTSGVMSEGGTPDFKFYVFEHWDLEETTALERYKFLQGMIEALPESARCRIVLVDQTVCSDITDLKPYYDQSLAMGYEGLIVKGMFKPYKRGRSTINSGHALKWKEFEDINCQIVSVKQGMKNLNEKKKDELGKAKRSTAKAGKVPVEEVGGFEVKCIEPESKFFGVTFYCGPGSLTDPELKALWLNREELPGQIIKVKIQKSGAKDKPRFPGFAGFRHVDDTGSCN